MRLAALWEVGWAVHWYFKPCWWLPLYALLLLFFIKMLWCDNQRFLLNKNLYLLLNVKSCLAVFFEVELEEIKAAQLFTVCPGISSEGAGCPIKNSRVSNKIMSVFTICSFADHLRETFVKNPAVLCSSTISRSWFDGGDVSHHGSHSHSSSVLSNDHTVDFITEKVEHQRKSTKRKSICRI